MEFKLLIGFTPEATQLIPNLVNALTGGTPAKQQATVKQMTAKQETKTDAVNNGAGDFNDEGGEAVSLEDVRKAATAKKEAGKSAHVKSALDKIGVKTLPEIPKEKRGEFLELLKAS